MDKNTYIGKIQLTLNAVTAAAEAELDIAVITNLALALKTEVNKYIAYLDELGRP